MPQIVAVFLVSFWASMALFGFIAWYWALAGWFVMGAVIEALCRRRRAAPKKPQ